MTRLVRARVVDDGCAECRNELLKESQALGGLPLAGEIVIVPEHWLRVSCPHGRRGLKLKALHWNGQAGRISDAAVEAKDFECYDRLDATKNIGYPVREHGRYGSHPIHDGFGDESWPD